jgi:hypothetical protein
MDILYGRMFGMMLPLVHQGWQAARQGDASRRL